MDGQSAQPELDKSDYPLDDIISRIVGSYPTDDRTHHIYSTFLPNRNRTIEIIEALRKLIFPGFFDEHRLASDTIRDHVGELLDQVRELLYEQIRQALRYEANRVPGPGHGDGCNDCDEEAGRITIAFLGGIPELRRLLATDIQAASDGDPAAVSTDETIFCYPGIDAIFTHRVAHALYQFEVPLLPRIMAEYAHNETGIDIHPGAQIGESFFIDHGTGVVIGETTAIGKHVQIYQGVTLGALAPKDGNLWRGRKRHPTIEDNVTIYAGAILLGGDTVIGAGSVIGGSVFITRSVPPGHTVTMEAPKLTMRKKRQKRTGTSATDSNFQI